MITTKRRFLMAAPLIPSLAAWELVDAGENGPVKEVIGEVPIHARSCWEAMNPIGSRMEVRKREGAVKYITIHHTATSLVGVRDPKTTILGNQKFHQKSIANGGREWGDIAYHYMVTPDGTAYEARDPDYSSDGSSPYLTKEQWESATQDEIGRTKFDFWTNNLAKPGATDPHINVAFVGKYYEEGEEWYGKWGVDEVPSQPAIDTVELLVAGLMKKYILQVEDVYFHREVGSTDCPGNLIYRHFRGESMERRTDTETFDRIKVLRKRLG